MDRLEQRKNEIEERADKRRRNTMDALTQIRDNYIRGAIEDQREWPDRDPRTVNLTAHIASLFTEMVDRLLDSPPIGLSKAEWISMLKDYHQSSS
jgi:hypothetical protein